MIWRIRLALQRRRYLKDARKLARVAEARVLAPDHPVFYDRDVYA